MGCLWINATILGQTSSAMGEIYQYIRLTSLSVVINKVPWSNLKKTESNIIIIRIMEGRLESRLVFVTLDL